MLVLLLLKERWLLWAW